MKEKVLVSTFSLIGSLAFYYYGKSTQKDIAPCTMIGGFVGAWVGELIAQLGSASTTGTGRQEENGTERKSTPTKPLTKSKPHANRHKR